MLPPEQRERLVAAAADAERRGARRSTAWRVITGAPGSGKSSLCAALSEAGFTVVADPGRYLLEAQAARGRPVAATRRDYAEFQLAVVEHAAHTMARLDRSRLVFFDYGVAESLAFLSAAGLDWAEPIVEAAVHWRFAAVYELELIPLEAARARDGFRTETTAQRHALQTLIPDVYRALGERVVNVSLASVPARLDRVLYDVAARQAKPAAQ